MKDDVIGFNEIPIKPSDSTFTIDGTLKDFEMNYHKNEDKLLRLAYGYQGNDAINGTSIISLENDNFTDGIFKYLEYVLKNFGIFICSKSCRRYCRRGKL